MAQILGTESPWNGDDVGGIYISNDDGHQKLHIYINLDNKEMTAAENKMAKRNSENTLDSFRQNHRALITYHLYLLGISDETGELRKPNAEDDSNTIANSMDYSEYRKEMIRLNRTALYATKEYLDTIRELDNIDGD
jgi:hypothetical protein